MEACVKSSSRTIVAVGATAKVVALGDIAEGALGLGRVEQRVDEAERGAALGLAVVVEDTNQSGDGRAGRRSTQNLLETATDDDLVLDTDEGNVGVATAVGVVVAVVGVAERVGVGGSDVPVVVGSVKVPRETTTCGLLANSFTFKLGPDSQTETYQEK